MPALYRQFVPMTVDPRKVALSVVLACCFSRLRCPSSAFAHASDRGYVLLLPTGYYLFGGAIAVAASFLALLFVPQNALERLAAWRLPLFAVPDALRFWTSLASFLILCCADCRRHFRQPRSAVQPAAASGVDAALDRADHRPGPVRQSLELDRPHGMRR